MEEVGDHHTLDRYRHERFNEHDPLAQRGKREGDSGGTELTFQLYLSQPTDDPTSTAGSGSPPRCEGSNLSSMM